MSNAVRRTVCVILTLTAMSAIPPLAIANDAEVFGPPQRTFQFTYTVTVSDIPDSAGDVKLWIPIPQSNDVQQIRNLLVKSDGAWQPVTESKYGNTFVEVDLSDHNGGTARFALSVMVDRTRTVASFSADQAQHNGNGEFTRYLQPSAFISIQGAVADEAARVTGAERDPLKQAKMLYDHIVNTVVYDKTGEGWGRGDSQYACDMRAGNCTDFHSLFIGEARSLGLPARFIMGFSIPDDAPTGDVGGYHCWAEFYTEQSGWAPIDASEAHKHPERREFLFGGLDANRVDFTVGRDLDIPGAASGPLNFSIYPHVEVDGKKHAAVSYTFAYRDVP